MATDTTIPTLPSNGTTSPVPSAASSSLPALPSLPSLDSVLGVDTSQGALTGLAAAANGVSVGQQQQNEAGSVVGHTTAATNGVFAQLGEWLKSIALPGTLAIVGLLIIVLSVYMAVTGAKKHWG
jgi:hypothetical protein